MKDFVLQCLQRVGWSANRSVETREVVELLRNAEGWEPFSAALDFIRSYDGLPLINPAKLGFVFDRPVEPFLFCAATGEGWRPQAIELESYLERRIYPVGVLSAWEIFIDESRLLYLIDDEVEEVYLLGNTFEEGMAYLFSGRYFVKLELRKNL